ncbi:MAG TPA: hypothetical protein PL115_01380 [Bacteroidales bacterium]|nr:hypothetical protein [Bacteroidales bacterium]HPY21733.1 hypothetical protein [Bacteroidales bacterium]HQA93146.1 hypothetical protein [Bacteroidales bacterium]HQP78497.1 hypothetical protein [Bacteroidales bacterium]
MSGTQFCLRFSLNGSQRLTPFRSLQSLQVSNSAESPLVLAESGESFYSVLLRRTLSPVSSS